MLTVYSDAQLAHHGKGEFCRGRLLPSVECPARAERVLERLHAVCPGSVSEPAAHDLAGALAVHDPAYVAFLRQAHAAWVAAHGDGDAWPTNWPMSQGPGAAPRAGESIDAQLGRYAFAIDTPITAGAWASAAAGAGVAVDAVSRLHAGASAVFALCRPPGHHAGRASYGGYCFLNNAAIAAQAHLERGGSRVAILDVDYHHGNGTQEIFYRRGEVLTVSLHADPRVSFPFFTGHADETGGGDGLGANLNLELPLGTTWPGYEPALRRALERVVRFAPDLLIVALGVDTYAGDPITEFGLVDADYRRLGAAMPTDVPLLVVLEGGYDLATIGGNVVTFLAACDETRSGTRR